MLQKIWTKAVIQNSPSLKYNINILKILIKYGKEKFTVKLNKEELDKYFVKINPGEKLPDMPISLDSFNEESVGGLLGEIKKIWISRNYSRGIKRRKKERGRKTGKNKGRFEKRKTKKTKEKSTSSDS